MTVFGAYRGNVRDDLGWLNSAGRPDPNQTFHRANLPRVGLDDVAAAATGVMLSTPIYLVEGDVVTNLTFISAGTAAATPTAYWFALYSRPARCSARPPTRPAPRGQRTPSRPWPWRRR
jgi:hypothetical protein